MKILKLPVETKINCSCGCEFEFDEDDIDVFGYWADHHEYKTLRVLCPFCKEWHELMKIEQ